MTPRHGRAITRVLLLGALLLPAYASVADETHAAESRLVLSDAQLAEAGLSIATAGPGTLVSKVALPGQIVLNADRQVHVAPRLAGVVREVRKTLGETVAAGEILAVLDSRDLADLNADYLAADARVALAEVTFAREKDLWRQQISAEQDYLAARQALAEARIARRQARQKLQALGLPAAHFAALDGEAAGELTRYELSAPAAGTIIAKDVTPGEVVDGSESLFTIADLDTVWVDLSVYPRDLPLVEAGREVAIAATGTDLEATARIGYVQPLADTETRAVLARIVLDNQNGRWRPGLFVTARVAAGAAEAAVLVPHSAVQALDAGPAVFVAHDGEFEVRPVVPGRSDAASIEILEGLAAGERYVAENGFVLKAELGKGEAEHDH